VRQEHVTLYNVQISQLYDLIKEYLKGLKLDIIHEEKDEDYWDVKAHKGGKGSVIVGNVRDVEIMISGARSAIPYYDVILRRGKDIVVPTAIAAAVTAGIAAAPVAAVEAYRAHSFEKKFWEFISTAIADIGKGEAKMSSPVAITP
jgi:hypothetical protein